MVGAIVEVHEPGRRPLRLVLTGPLDVGRDCDGLLLTDGEISRRHLELRPTAQGVEVADLDSTNGTFVDGRRLTGPIIIAPGHEVRFGNCHLTVVPGSSAVSIGRDTAVAGVGRRTSIDEVADLAVADRTVPDDHEHRHGTITIVFTDIEGSTERVGRLGDDEWMGLLDLHNKLVRSIVRRHDGTEAVNHGDGFMFTFRSARRAVQAMTAVQRQLAEAPMRLRTDELRIRVGMHTGEVIVGDDGHLFGQHIHVAARVAGQAAGGEILVSALTRSILETRGDIAFGDVRLVDLKGIPGQHSIFPVLWQSGMDAL